MSATFSVKNFEKFQHYKDRSPPWIRLYNSLLDDYAFGRLPDASKAHLLAIWLLASRYENKIPFDPEWVSRRINATEPVDLEGLAEAGFIIPDQACSALLAERKQIAMPEKSRGETEEKEENTVGSACAEPHPATAGDERVHSEEMKPKGQTYPQEFDELWNDYRGVCDAASAEPGSKKNAFERWRKLSAEDRQRCFDGVMAYTVWRIDRAEKPGVFTAQPKHFERFISGRLWETYQTEAA